MSESNPFKLSVDHVLSQICDLDRCANIFSIVAFFLLTVLMYDMRAITLSAIVTLDSFRNFAYVSNYLHLKSFA